MFRRQRQQRSTPPMSAPLPPALRWRVPGASDDVTVEPRPATVRRLGDGPTDLFPALNRALEDAAPSFLSAFHGYNRQQVDEWVRWQLQQLARARQRAVEAEQDVWELKGELDATYALASGEGIHGLRLLPTDTALPRRQPRHLRRDPNADRGNPLGDRAWSLPAPATPEPPPETRSPERAERENRPKEATRVHTAQAQLFPSPALYPGPVSNAGPPTDAPL